MSQHLKWALGLETQGFGKPQAQPFAVGMLWEAQPGSFCWGSFGFPTVEEHGGPFPMLDVREREVGAQPRGLGQPQLGPRTTRGLLVKASRDGQGGPSN